MTLVYQFAGFTGLYYFHTTEIMRSDVEIKHRISLVYIDSIAWNTGTPYGTQHCILGCYYLAFKDVLRHGPIVLEMERWAEQGVLRGAGDDLSAHSLQSAYGIKDGDLWYEIRWIVHGSHGVYNTSVWGHAPPPHASRPPPPFPPGASPTSSPPGNPPAYVYPLICTSSTLYHDMGYKLCL